MLNPFKKKKIDIDGFFKKGDYSLVSRDVALKKINEELRKSLNKGDINAT